MSCGGAPGDCGEGFGFLWDQAVVMGLLSLGSVPQLPEGRCVRRAWVVHPWPGNCCTHPSPDLGAENRNCPSLCFHEPPDICPARDRQELVSLGFSSKLPASVLDFSRGHSGAFSQ